MPHDGDRERPASLNPISSGNSRSEASSIFRVSVVRNPLGCDYRVEDENGREAFRIDGRVWRIASMFDVLDCDDQLLLSVRGGAIWMEDALHLVRHRQDIASVRRVGETTDSDCFVIDLPNGRQAGISGDVRGCNYVITYAGRQVASISRLRRTAQEFFMVEVMPQQAAAAVITMAICLDIMVGG